MTNKVAPSKDKTLSNLLVIYRERNLIIENKVGNEYGSSEQFKISEKWAGPYGMWVGTSLAVHVHSAGLRPYQHGWAGHFTAWPILWT